SYFHKLLSFIQKRAVICFTLFVTLIGVCAWGLQYSKLQLDIYDVYDPGFQSSVDLSDMKSFYNDRSQMLVAFHFKTTPKAGEICQLLEWSKSLSRYKEIKA